MFDMAPVGQLLMGLGTGLVFGFILQKAGVTRYQVILGQFLWKDHTVLRTMLTAVVVGAIGIYGMLALGILQAGDLHVKSATLLANAIGGIIFGIGMATLGYCPGTGVAAVGEGSRHAIFGVLGMLVGAAVYAEVHPTIAGSLLKAADFGKVRFPEITPIPGWAYVVALVVIAGVVFALLPKSGGKSGAP